MLSGKAEASKVRFAFEGVTYEVLLTLEERRKLAQLLAPYVSVASTLTTPRVSSKAVRTDIRRWGRENGFKVAPEGRLPYRLLAAYQESHPGLVLS